MVKFIKNKWKYDFKRKNMKFKRKKFLRLTSLTLAPFSVFTALISAGCFAQQNSLISEVNYLALGDSLTAGFNQETFHDFQGKLDKDGNLNGQSYPAFFAHFLQKLNKDSLVSYNNLAISGTTTENWLHFLNPKKYPKGKLSENPLASGYTGNEKINEINSVFGKFDKSSYPELIEKITKANLLTMSVGANDPFVIITKFIPFLVAGTESYPEDIKKLIESDKNNQTQIIGNYIKSEVNKKIEEFKTNLDNLVKELKEINPNLKINFIGYNLPKSILVHVLKHLLYNEFKIELEFIKDSTDKINNIIRETSMKNGVNYVDVYDKNLWNDSDKKLAATEFDIHPQIQGYKKIAHQLLLKLTLDPNEGGDSSEVDFKNTKNFDDILNGKATYSRIIDINSFAKSNKEFLDKLNDNKKTSEFIESKSTFETKQDELVKNSKSSIKDVIKNFLGSELFNSFDIKKYLLETSELLKTYASSIFDGFHPSGSFLKDLENLQEKFKHYLKDPNTQLVDFTIQTLVNYLEEISAPGSEEKININSILTQLKNKLFSLVDIKKVFGGNGINYSGILGGGKKPTATSPTQTTTENEISKPNKATQANTSR
ncbi:SGNH/GDSL hydrolase family protein [Mycoplasma flocculare]|nr:SGNH/GDSL hydrolase family protein [Mesomycoplasma flocculare]